MTEAGKLPVNLREEQRVILREVLNLLGIIGSANDAEDHGYDEDADRMRKDSCEELQHLMLEHTFLAELFPTFHWELETGHILGFGWSDLFHDADNHLKPPLNGLGNN